MSDLSGKMIGHYKIIEQVGQGGMGVVYKAHDASLNRNVALKFLPPHLTKDNSTRKRFMVEAQAASALDHPNICNIHEIGEAADGQLFICMAYYDGESLRDKISKGPIPIEESFRVFTQIAQGINAAHEKNIIHRDIKPANILLTENGDIKIVDFGLAKLAGEQLTESFSTKGTIAYLAPEVIRGAEADHRSDIWSLGVLLFEMLTGHLPFKGDYPEPLMYSIVNEEPFPLSKYLSDVPKYLQDLIDKLLRKEPADRYQNIKELHIDLEKLKKETGSIYIAKKQKSSINIFQKKSFLYSFIFIILILLTIFVWQKYLQQENLTIAVLPVKGNADSTGSDIFNETMAYDVSSKLSQISQLDVISYLSSMQYINSEKSNAQITSELNAKYLIEISSIKINNLVKIKTKLFITKNNKFMWSNDYENEIKNIIGIQGQIAKEIAYQINVVLTKQELTLLNESREVNPEVYDLYSMGMDNVNKGNFLEGIAYFRKAIIIDSTESLAHAGLAIALSINSHSANPLPNAKEDWKKHAFKAVKLNENLAEAHLAVAMLRIYYLYDMEGAGQSYRRALDLNPNLTLALFHHAFYLDLLGNKHKAIQSLKRAIELDPLSFVYPAQLAHMVFFHKEFDKTIELAHKSLSLMPDDPFALYLVGEGYAGKGMYKEAIKWQKKAAELSPEEWKWGLAHTYALAGDTIEAIKITKELEEGYTSWDTWCIAMNYAALGDADKVFYWLEKAHEMRHPWTLWVNTHYVYLKEYMEDPRFIEFVTNLDLPDWHM